MVRVSGVGGIEVLQPQLGRSNDLGRIVLGQLHTRPAANPVHRMLECRQQDRDRLAFDRHVRRQVALGHRDAVDAAVLVVAARVADVVLHMADDRVGPVGHVQRPVVTDLEVAGTKVGVGRYQQIAGFGAVDISGLGIELELVLLDPEERDDIEDQEVALALRREMITGENPARGYRPHGLLEQLAHREVTIFGGLYLEGPTAGPIRGVVVTPVVEVDAMGVGTVGRMKAERPGARVEPVHARCRRLLIGAPRRLDVRDVEHATLVVEEAIRAVDEVVRRVMRISRPERAHDADADIRHIIAVGVLEKEQVRHRGDDHAAVPELESRRVVNVRERDGLVRYTIAILVRQDQQAIVHRLGGFPLRVGSPRGDPEAAAAIDSQLYRVHELGKHLLRCEDVGDHAGCQRHPIDAIFGRQEIERPRNAHPVLNLRFAEVGDDLDRRQHVGVVGFDRLATRSRPDDRVAVSGHHVELREFVLQHLEVVLTIGELERRARAPDIVAIGRPKAIVPVPVLVEDGRANSFQPCVAGAGRSTQEILHDDHGDLSIPLLAKMNAVDRQGHVRCRIQLL